MELTNHPGLSEADVEAAEVLDELRKTMMNTRNQMSNITQQQQRFNPTIIKNPDDESRSKSTTREGSINLLNRVVNNVVTFYDDRRKVASIARLLDDAYEDNYTTSEGESDSDSESESESDDVGKHKSKKHSHHHQQSYLQQPQSEIKLTGNHTEKKRSHEEEEEEEEDKDCERTNEYDEDDDESSEIRFSKRQKISEAIDNFKEYKFNMSIESKKRLITCLHLLKLANKQLSEKVTNLQDLVQKEHEAEYQHQIKMELHHAHLKRNPYNKDVSISSLITHENDNNDKDNNNDSTVIKPQDEEDEEDEFFDAFDSKENNEQATIIKMEVVGTIKKVYSMISRFTGSSLPEPARSQVRASLLNLPTNWSSTVSHLSGNDKTNTAMTLKKPDVTMTLQNTNEEEPNISTNGKVLILAKESLDMVHNVMEVVDSTLGKAEEWVKQKQEIKEVLYEKFRQTKVNKDK